LARLKGNSARFMWLFKKKDAGDFRDKSDEDVIRLYRQNGDKTLFAHLFKQHVTQVYGTCIFYLKDKEEAKDAVMHIFEKMLADLKKTEVQNFKGWLGFVVRNHCISLLRKKNTVLKNTEAYYEFEYKDPVYEEEVKAEKVNDEILLTYIQQCLPELKENQKICVQAFYLHGMSYQQISEKNGFSTNEVKSYIQNGKRNLKLLIEEKLRKPFPDA